MQPKVKSLGEILGLMGSIGEGVPQTNRSAHVIINNFAEEVNEAIQEQTKKPVRDAYDEAVSRIRGLKGALSLIRRVSGRPGYRIAPEKGSVLDNEVDEILNMPAIIDKQRRIRSLYNRALIQIDNTTDWQIAEQVIATFKSEVKNVLHEQPLPVYLPD